MSDAVEEAKRNLEEAQKAVQEAESKQLLSDQSMYDGEEYLGDDECHFCDWARDTPFCGCCYCRVTPYTACKRAARKSPTLYCLYCFLFIFLVGLISYYSATEETTDDN